MGNIQVETFDKSFSADGSTHTLTNDVGNTDNAFVLNLTARRTSGGPTGSAAHTNWDDFVAAVELTDTNQLTFYRPAVGAGTIRMFGEVWRYSGQPGGNHEFISRWRGQVTIASGNATADQVVSGISDIDDVVCFVTGVEANLASRSNGNRVIADAYMTSDSNLRVERGETGTAVTVHVEVVEFTGSAWNIGHFDSGDINTANSVTPTVYQTYNWTGDAMTVSDWATAFIWADMLGDVSGNHALEDTWFVVQDNTSTTVLITLDSSAVCGRVRGYVLQNDDLSVERETAGKSIPAGLDISLTDPSNITTAGERSIAECYVFSNGGGTAYARGAVSFKLNGATVEAWVHRSGNVGTYRYAGIDLSGLTGEESTSTTTTGSTTSSTISTLSTTTSSTYSTISTTTSSTSSTASTTSSSTSSTLSSSSTSSTVSTISSTSSTTSASSTVSTTSSSVFTSSTVSSTFTTSSTILPAEVIIIGGPTVGKTEPKIIKRRKPKLYKYESGGIELYVNILTKYEFSPKINKWSKFSEFSLSLHLKTDVCSIKVVEGVNQMSVKYKHQVQFLSTTKKIETQDEEIIVAFLSNKC